MVREKTFIQNSDSSLFNIANTEDKRLAIKKLGKKAPNNKWTDSEYNLLVMMVRQYGEDWQTIASNLINKTAKQCMQKFKNSQRSAKKGNWVQEEDDILLQWVKDYGATKWTECSKLIKGRCGKQCRERWVNILNPFVKKGNWSDEEQNLIFDSLNLYSTSWSSISKVLPGRTENSIKNYFYSSLRRLKSSLLCNLIKDVYVTKTMDLRTANENKSLLTDEISTLNTLSKRICDYLLNMESKNDSFIQFLIPVIFNEDQPSIAVPPKKAIIQTNPKILPNHIEAAIYVPQEKNKQMISTVIESKENDTMQVISVLKKMINQVNKPGLLSVINFLENQLVNNNISSVMESRGDGIKIKLPFCWNCKTKSCNLHDKHLN